MVAISDVADVTHRYEIRLRGCEITPNKAGLILGSFLGLLKIAWSFMVALGVAQWLLDWIFYLHFLNNPLRVATFSFSVAFVVVVLSAIIGYIVGAILLVIWNAVRSTG